jgi:uncharacterized protein involved in exopolysaccharide biosynthesis
MDPADAMMSADRTAQSADSTVDVRSMWNLLRENLALIAGTTLAGILIATAIALTATPIFRAEVVVAEVEEPGGPLALAGQLGGLASLAGVNLGGLDGGARRAAATLRSRSLAEEFVRKHQLLPELLRGSSKPPTLWLGVERFRRKVLSIREDSRTQLITVGVAWTDPADAARLANSYVSMADELLRARAIEDATRNIEYLNRQIAATTVVEVQRVMYKLVETETKTLMLANARREYAFTVVDPAVPPELRHYPRRTAMVVIGAIAGLLLGIAAVVLRRSIAR